MALSIGQMAALSYNDVLKVKNLPENQWAENAAMRWLEKNGYIKRRNLGPQIEIPLDYRINPNAEFLVRARALRCTIDPALQTDSTDMIREDRDTDHAHDW